MTEQSARHKRSGRRYLPRARPRYHRASLRRAKIRRLCHRQLPPFLVGRRFGGEDLRPLIRQVIARTARTVKKTSSQEIEARFVELLFSAIDERRRARDRLKQAEQEDDSLPF